jgi:type IV pilus assembly protein PilB
MSAERAPSLLDEVLEGRRPRLRLGEALIAAGVIDAEQLALALADQRQTQAPLGHVLVRLGFARPEDVARQMAEQLGLEYARAADLKADPLLVSALDVDFVREVAALPLRLAGGVLEVAMVDPTDVQRVAALRRRFLTGLRIQVVTNDDLNRLVRRYFATDQHRASSLIEGREAGAGEGQLPIESMVAALLREGIRSGATDVHIQPDQGVTRVRFRGDGVLSQGDLLPGAAAPALVSRIKVLAGLDIAERRRPQDGHLSFEVDGRSVDLRVSVMPTQNGETAVLRVLDRAAGNLSLAELGFDAQSRHLLDLICARPHGLFLVTGPTGSGKTTTLYSMLARVDSQRRNVATVEDPVEFDLPFVRQSKVEADIGFDFQSGLRALLRQDPDVILVGEIRDCETATMALRAAMTGHLVFSTLHTNSALGVLPRLVDLGAAAYLLEDALIGVLAQRLVRRICNLCAEEVEPSDAERAWLGGPVGALRRGRGCGQCGGTGFSGRVAIAELFLPDDAMAPLLRDGTQLEALRAAAEERGFRDLQSDGRAKVRAGLTTVDEVLRVCRSHRLSEAERAGDRRRS